MSNGNSADCTELSMKYIINEYITGIFKEKLPGFQALVVFTVLWVYFLFYF